MQCTRECGPRCVTREFSLRKRALSLRKRALSLRKRALSPHAYVEICHGAPTHTHAHTHRHTHTDTHTCRTRWSTVMKAIPASAGCTRITCMRVKRRIGEGTLNTPVRARAVCTRWPVCVLQGRAGCTRITCVRAKRGVGEGILNNAVGASALCTRLPVCVFSFACVCLLVCLCVCSRLPVCVFQGGGGGWLHSCHLCACKEGGCACVCVNVCVCASLSVSMHRKKNVQNHSVLWHTWCVAVCCGVLRCVAVCCSVLQCVAVCCSVL